MKILYDNKVNQFVLLGNNDNRILSTDFLNVIFSYLQNSYEEGLRTGACIISVNTNNTISLNNNE